MREFADKLAAKPLFYQRAYLVRSPLTLLLPMASQLSQVTHPAAYIFYG